MCSMLAFPREESGNRHMSPVGKLGVNLESQTVYAGRE